MLRNISAQVLGTVENALTVLGKATKKLPGRDVQSEPTLSERINSAISDVLSSESECESDELTDSTAAILRFLGADCDPSEAAELDIEAELERDEDVCRFVDEALLDQSAEPVTIDLDTCDFTVPSHARSCPK
jgi:hypothetical protein